MRRHPVGDRLDSRLGVDRHDSGLDQVRDVRPHHHQAEELAVARLVDRLHPTGGLVLHHRTRICSPGEHSGRDVVAVLFARFGLGQPDTGNLGIRVDRTRNGAVVDRRLVPARVLRRNLAFAKSGMGELPVAGAIADRVDVVDGRASMFIRSDSLPLVELDADRFETDALDARSSTDRDEHEIGLDGLAVSEENGDRAAALLDLRALLLEVERDPTLAKLLGELSGRVGVFSQPMIPPPRTTSRFGTSVWASRPSESTQRSESSPSIGGRSGNDPVAMIADLKVTSSPPSTAIVFASLKVPLPLTHSTPFALNNDATPCVICLTTPAFHSLARPNSSWNPPSLTPSLSKVCSASFSAKAVCTQAFVGMQPIRKQVPPSSGSRSMHTVFAPSCAARIAAV